MRDEQTELKPCPFCLSEHVTDRYVRDGRQMFCQNCGASVSPTYNGPNNDTIARAVEAWNRRAAISPPIDAGWQMVPVEPTREMWAAMADTLYGYKNRHHDKVVGDLWKAMLAAAPHPAPIDGRGEAAVKALEWQDDEHSSQGLTTADDGFGHLYWIYAGNTYIAAHSGPWYMGIRPLRDQRDNDQKCDNLAAAKAAAQTDYEARIRSALTHPAPAPGPADEDQHENIHLYDGDSALVVRENGNKTLHGMQLPELLAHFTDLPAGEAGDLIERLKDDAKGCSDEGTMKWWDRIRAMIIAGDKSDQPRLIFDSIIDGFAQNADEAASALAAYQAKNKWLVECIDRQALTIYEYRSKLETAAAYQARAEKAEKLGVTLAIKSETNEHRAKTAEAKVAALQRKLEVSDGALDAALKTADWLVATLRSEIEALNTRCVETQMLAHKWMEAHDKLHAGKPYSFPKPVDLPEAIARAEAAEAKVAALTADLEAKNAQCEKTCMGHPIEGHKSWVSAAALEKSDRTAAALRTDAKRVVSELKFALFASDMTIKDRADQSARLFLAALSKVEG